MAISSFDAAWNELAPSIASSTVTSWDWFADQKSVVLFMIGLVGATVYFLAGFVTIMFVRDDVASRHEAAQSSRHMLVVGLLFYIAFVMPASDDFDFITDIWFAGTTAVCALIVISALFFK